MPKISQRSVRTRRPRRSATRKQQQPSQVRSIPGEWDPAVVDVIPRRHPPEQACTIRRTYSLATLSANTGDTVLAFYFTLGNMPNSTDFTNLFDQYKIVEAVVTFTPYATMVPSTSVASAYPGMIGTWLDYDDANLPANMAEGQQVETFQRNMCTVPFTRVVRPRCAVAAYSGAFTSYASVKNQWIDTSSPNVQWYGLKTVVTGSTYATSTKVYEIEATVTMTFRSIK